MISNTTAENATENQGALGQVGPANVGRWLQRNFQNPRKPLNKTPPDDTKLQ